MNSLHRIAHAVQVGLRRLVAGVVDLPAAASRLAGEILDGFRRLRPIQVADAPEPRLANDGGVLRRAGMMPDMPFALEQFPARTEFNAAIHQYRQATTPVERQAARTRIVAVATGGDLPLAAALVNRLADPALDHAGFTTALNHSRTMVELWFDLPR
jgi:hypothetical protein